MKKISSKIIIFFLLTVFLWGGVGFDSIGIKRVSAQISPTGALVTPGTIVDATASTEVPDATNCNSEHAAWQANPKDGNTNAAYVACLNRTQATAAANRVAGDQWENTLSAAMAGLDFTKMLADGILKTVLATVAGIYQLAIIPLLGVIVRISAACLDLALKFTLDSKNITDIDSAILQTWMIIRNIFNITFIFILLYTAIRTILGTAGTDTKKTIANVIVAALLINFSLFITRILIDAGNILAVTLYNAATNNGVNSFSGTLVNALGIGILWGKTGVNCTVCVPFFVATAIQTIILISSSIIVIYVTLLMIARTVVLIFLMAISPIGFMGDILPQVKEYSKKWRENLFGQIFIAPIFLLFYYLIINISGNFTATGINLTNTESANYAGIFKFVIILVLLFAAVKITKKMSGDVGGFVEKAGMMVAGAAIGYATGGLAMAGRQTLGRAAASGLKGEKGEQLRAAAARGDVGARMKLASYEGLSKATFDARNTKTFGKGLTQANKVAGLNVDPGKASGTYGKGTGFAGGRDEEQDKQNKIYNELAKVTNKQRRAANEAKNLRDDQVKIELDDHHDKIDPSTGLVMTDADGKVIREGNNADYTRIKAEKEKYTEVKDTHKDLVTEQTGFTEAQAEKARLDALSTVTTRTAAEDLQYKKDVAQANRAFNEAKRVKAAKKKEIQEELKKKYSGEIAQLDDELKRIKSEVEMKVETGKIKNVLGREVLNNDQKQKLAVINRARDYANSVRENGGTGILKTVRRVRNIGRGGLITSDERAADLAEGMETQKAEAKS